MKKIITLICISFFVLVSCTNSYDIEPVSMPLAPVAQAVFNEGFINVTWTAVPGNGITYNVYRNDDPVKINSTPLTEAKFIDVLKNQGSYIYTVTVNLSGIESAKGTASEKVEVYLPKTITTERYSINSFNGVLTPITDRIVNVFTYDSENITKLVNISESFSYTTWDNKAANSKTNYIYTYSGNLITKEESFDEVGDVIDSVVFEYNDKNKITTEKLTHLGNSSKSVFVYNVDGTVTETSNNLTFVYSYLNGNMVKYVGTDNNPNLSRSWTFTYLFDTKNNPTKYILGFTNLARTRVVVLTEIKNVNNIINSFFTESGYSSTSRSEYTYDANGNVLTEKNFTKGGNNPEELRELKTYTY